MHVSVLDHIISGEVARSEGFALLVQVTVRELLAQVRQDFSPSGNFFGGESANLTLSLLYDTLDDLTKHGKVVYHAHSANPDYRSEGDTVGLKAPAAPAVI